MLNFRNNYIKSGRVNRIDIEAAFRQFDERIEVRSNSPKPPPQS